MRKAVAKMDLRGTCSMYFLKKGLLPCDRLNLRDRRVCSKKMGLSVSNLNGSFYLNHPSDSALWDPVELQILNVGVRRLEGGKIPSHNHGMRTRHQKEGEVGRESLSM